MAFRKVFFAYPGAPEDLANTIALASEKFAQMEQNISLTPWPQMDIFGAAIADKVRDNIDQIDVLFGDITFANLNVYYELGYAIG